MSQRRELLRHIDRLGEIGELLGAMRSLALAESRRIATFIDAQRQSAAIVRGAYARLLHDHGTELMRPAIAGRVVCVIGSERGFCGDLNQRLAADALQHAATEPDTRWLLVGSQLAEAWPDDGPPTVARIAGAGMADEVLAVQAALLAALTPLLNRADTLPALQMHRPGPAGIVHTPLLPMPQPDTPLPPASHPVALNLTPTALQAALLDQYLDAALAGLLLEALLHENEQRLAHMDQARRNVDEHLATLARQANRARQEEITEEIEIILLAGAAEGVG
jgi:F-type H+-transporting ATPase subunit gamma